MNHRSIQMGALDRQAYEHASRGWIATGIGEGGPISEIPVELVRKNFETNVFAALDFTQRVVRNWVATVFTERWYSSPQLLDFLRSRQFPHMPRANMPCNL